MGRRHAGRGQKELLLSAAIIVRDEEAAIGACLERLGGLVDEIVVYDTGSHDRTVAIAEAAGATVVCGFWDDDFARARNEAMRHCRGHWVLSVDADEQVEADAAIVRAQLRSRPAVDAFLVDILNLEGSSDAPRPGPSHLMLRLGRRGRVSWTHRLHETLRTTEGGIPRYERLDNLRLVHRGYLDDVVEHRHKRERNIRVALEDVASSSPADPEARAAKLLSLARSYVYGGDVRRAIDCFAEARQLDCSRDLRRVIRRHAIDALINAGELAEATVWLSELEDIVGPQAPFVRYFRARLALGAGDADAALDALGDLVSLDTEEGIRFGSSQVVATRGTALGRAGRWDEALDLMIGSGAEIGWFDWRAILVALEMSGRSVPPVAELVDESGVPHVAVALGHVTGPVAAAFLEALWGRMGPRPCLLAAGAFVAPRLTVGAAMEWSARLRAAGMAQLCPMHAIVEDPARPAIEQLRAACVLRAAFSDGLTDGDLRGVAGRLREEEFAAALAEVDGFAPELLPAVIAGATSTPARALAMGETLRRLGAQDAAEVVLVGVFGHADVARAHGELTWR